MIKVYGIAGCKDCEWVKPQLDSRFEFIEIDNVKAMHEFIDLRDNRKEFDVMKANGKIGIPCFVLEDGTISFTPEDFGLTSFTGKTSCSINGKGNC